MAAEFGPIWWLFFKTLGLKFRTKIVGQKSPAENGRPKIAGRKLFAENYQRILLIKFHHVFMSLIILHQVFSSLIKLQQVFNFLIKFHLNHKNLIISAPGLARMVLSVFLECIWAF